MLEFMIALLRLVCLDDVFFSFHYIASIFKEINKQKDNLKNTLKLSYKILHKTETF